MNFKKILYLIFQLLIFCSIGLALLIYTSQNPMSPIYENSGIQFLIILIICSPSLILLGLGLLLLKTKLEIPKDNIYFPFYSSVGILLPIIIDGGLHKPTLFIGTLLCIFFLIQSLVLPFKTLKAL
ncbi:hypothetical protein QYB59_000385 [Clostridium perfringens]|nr:hypothetical protein [Clostridium perfringens]